jgi:hypothetical protein
MFRAYQATAEFAMEPSLWRAPTRTGFEGAMALMFILQGEVQQHRQWMTRSFAAALIFLEARAILDLTGWIRYLEVIIWCCVAAAVPIADFILACQESHPTRTVPARLSRPPARQTVQ